MFHRIVKLFVVVTAFIAVAPLLKVVNSIFAKSVDAQETQLADINCGERPGRPTQPGPTSGKA